jgi:hypothetical protein
VLPSVYGIDMPKEYCEPSPPSLSPTVLFSDAVGCARSDEWLDWLDVQKFDWSDSVVPGACLVGGLKFRLLLRGLGPLLLMLVPLVLSIVPHIISYSYARIVQVKRANRTQQPFGEAFKVASLRALTYMIFISFALVQSVSAGIFSAWDCVEFTTNSVSGTQTAFLREDLSIECGSSQHRQLKNIAYIFFTIWPVGMPLLYLLVLLSCQDALVKKRSTPLTRATSFLHQEYRP